MPKKQKKKTKIKTPPVRKPEGILDRETEVKSRTCLKCNGEFESKGPGNRLCTKCGAENRAVRTKSSYMFQRGPYGSRPRSKHLGN